MSTNQNANPVQVLQTYFATLESRNWKELAAIVSDDFVFDNPVEPMTKQDFLPFMQGLLTAFPDWKFNHTDFRVQGNVVTVKLRMEGTHTQTLRLPMPGLRPVPATNKHVVLPAQDFAYVVSGDQIARITPEPIPNGGIIGTLQQIGVNLPPLWVMKLVTKASHIFRR
jgi:predicted ester cyclase